jgi:hypothetical protein
LYGRFAIALSPASATTAAGGPSANATIASSAWNRTHSRSEETITRTRSKRSATTPA